MKCKNCGGEILFSNKEGICQSCGVSLTPDSAYENTEVCICYIESDSAGRRTKDSIVAQEVYRKLEDHNINTFYERISADGMIGDDLASARYSAIFNSKLVIVLAESAEKFDMIEKEYSGLLLEKTVVPFCIDINPDKIPKSFSGIQAINYTTIGWEKDLIKGINRLLGREEKEVKGDLYGNTLKKKVIAICAITIVLLTVGAIVLWNTVGSGKDKASNQAETSSLSNQETYDKAVECMEDGAFTQALDLLYLIPDYPGSDSIIKQIYSKYEGFFQKDDYTIHLEILDNIYAEVELKVFSKEKITNISVNAEIAVNKVDCTYRDNHQNGGTLELILEDTGIKLIQKAESDAENKEIFFEFSDRTDQPIVKIEGETLQYWLDKNLTYNEISSFGYDLEEVEILDRAGANRLYRIQYTDIYLTICGDNDLGDEYLTNPILLGITAPAELIIPTKKGKPLEPILEGNVLYCPNVCLFAGPFNLHRYYHSSFEENGSKISENTMICMVNKNDFSIDNWNAILDSAIMSTIEKDIENRYKISLKDDWINKYIVAENSTDYLISVTTENLRDNGKNAWYKASKKNLKTYFLREGPDVYKNSYEIDGYIWIKEYADFSTEFPIHPEDCNHMWEYATCTTPDICLICQETSGTPSGHSWSNATCTEPRICEDCGETDGKPSGHTWTFVSCTEPNVCEECGESDDYIAGHDWITATCSDPMICSVCEKTSGEPLEHVWSEATCETPATCVYCGETGDYGLCNFTDIRFEGEESFKYCEVCGAPE